ncbi:DcaP family trimeric outer membrane transporter [Flavobacterium aestivum]|uniref:DcaP family trimeric outer membrane transporter n=1 Tax=Flavobacterium aestivum TaxID=3003257 RepID=UPI002482B039|nr:DcaP family trimeric outer membrane transporter [Flavobacterium aestivum]
MKKVTYSILLIFLFSIVLNAQSQEIEKTDKTMEIKGFIMLDTGYDFGKMDPNWYDSMRPTKILDSQGNEFKPQGNYFMGVRQTALSLRNYFDTGIGLLKTFIEFDLVGSGKDVGATTFHLRHAFAELGRFGVGQTNSLFSDVEVYPNMLEFMGPNAMSAFRNIQIRYVPIQSNGHRFAVALERPGATADQGQYGDEFIYASVLEHVNFRFTLPDFSTEYRYSASWGYVELASILRSIKWEDNNTDQFNLSGSAIGWGLSLSTRLKLANNIIYHGAFTTGAGIQNYMNDAEADIGIKRQYDNTLTPITGVSIPLVGAVSYFDIYWNRKFSSTIGYSILNNKTTEAQLSTAYKTGQYASVNLLYSPAKNCIMGPELQWGMRQNNDFAGDPYFNLPAAKGNSGTDLKLQFSFRYSFMNTFYKTN